MKLKINKDQADNNNPLSVDEDAPLTDEQEYFISKIKRVYDNVSNVGIYGNIQEFYDEDGVTLMVAETKEQESFEENCVVTEFTFTDTNETFTYKEAA